MRFVDDIKNKVDNVNMAKTLPYKLPCNTNYLMLGYDICYMCGEYMRMKGYGWCGVNDTLIRVLR